MKLPLAATCTLLAALALAACTNPTPACRAPLTECGGVCSALPADAQNCGACGNVCSGGKVCLAGSCGFSSCVSPDVFATCFQGGGVVGVCSVSGDQVSTAIVASPSVGDGGSATVGLLSSLGFAQSDRLWVVDTLNSRIDVLDTSSWPPATVTSIAAGAAQYDAYKLKVCGSQVLLLRDTVPLLEVFDAQTGDLINEVSLARDGGFANPSDVACDGQTAYVADSSDNLLTAVDLTTFAVIGSLGLPAADLSPPATSSSPGSDGGSTFYPSLATIAVGTPPAAAAQVFAALQNYSEDANFNLTYVADSTVLASDPGLSAYAVSLDPGTSCKNIGALLLSADQGTLFGACTGSFDNLSGTLNAVGYLSVIATAGLESQATVALPLSNPSSLALLKTGVVAVGDEGQAKIAFYNPADGGVSSAVVNCPSTALSDGGSGPPQFISAVVAAP